MKTNLLIIAAALALAGCGGSSTTTEPLTDLNPAFSGTWNGNTLVSVPGFPSSSFASQLVIVASGRTATITKLCPDGTGTLVASGSGSAAAWTGSLACPPVAVSGCSSVTASLTSANGSLSADATTLTVQAAGTASGCSFTSAVTLGFVGTK
jgi:uncharacterized protein YceK